MSNNVNKMIVIGHLGGDAVLREFASGKKGTFFSVATNEEYKDQNGEKQKITTWHKAALWGERAEKVVGYLTKGARVYISGEVRTRKYTDKTGIDREVNEIHVRELNFLGTSSSVTASREPAYTETPAVPF